MNKQQAKERYKMAVLVELSNFLYSNVDKHKEDFDAEELKKIRSFIDAKYKDHKKDIFALKREAISKKGLEYSVAVLHRMVQILTYIEEMPSEKNINKFLDACKKDVKSVFDFLMKFSEKKLHIEALTIYSGSEDFKFECFISLINTLDCMGYTGVSMVKPKDMGMIKDRPFDDIADLCGLIEAYKSKPQMTILAVNKILNKVNK